VGAADFSSGFFSAPRWGIGFYSVVKAGGAILKEYFKRDKQAVQKAFGSTKK